MAVYSYLAPSSSNPSHSLATGTEGIEAYANRHGLRIDREFVEEPGGFFVDRLNSDWRTTPLADRPVGKQLCKLLQPGDEVIVWQPMLEPAQLLSLADELRRRGIALHMAKFGVAATDPLLLAALKCFIPASRFIEAGPRSEGTKAGMAKTKARGGARGGRPAPGWKHVKIATGVRRAPDSEQRKVMGWIVDRRLEGWGWRRISSWLTSRRVMYKRTDASAPRGYTLEFWDPGRCKRAFAAMAEIVVDEEGEKQTREQGAGGAGFRPTTSGSP
jgi:DNA invertase Pin-like site-specific DNA recombinase